MHVLHIIGLGVISEIKQYVSVNSCNSDAMNVVCGVPQGSILGPKCFILYVNDTANVSSLLILAEQQPVGR